jgi:hypothetical protein
MISFGKIINLALPISIVKQLKSNVQDPNPKEKLNRPMPV